MAKINTLDPNRSGHPAVLLLHGLGADGSSWGLQMPALAEAEFRPIAPDTPGFGQSAYDGKGWNMKRMAAHMAGLLQELGAVPAHVVGLSMGGVIAQQLVLDFPQLTQKLVLVSTFAVLRPDDLSGWVYFLRRAVAVSTLGLHAQGRIVAERLFPGPDQAGLRMLLEETIASADPRAYRSAMRSLALFDSRRRLAHIHNPTLVLSGQEDSTVSPLRQQVLAQAIQGARQLVIPQAGHALSVDQAELFNRALLEFLGAGGG